MQKKIHPDLEKKQADSFNTLQEASTLIQKLIAIQNKAVENLNTSEEALFEMEETLLKGYKFLTESRIGYTRDRRAWLLSQSQDLKTA